MAETRISDEAAPAETVGAGPALPRAIVGVALVAAVALRAWILTTGLGGVDADEAVTGLMARHAAHGHFSVFFWGQHYGGSQEATATALLFIVLGACRITLKLVPITAYAGAAWVVWRIGLRTLPRRQAAVAALLFLLGPGFFVLRSTRAYGFYGTALLAAVLIVLSVLRLCDEPKPSTLELAWVGFLAGFGWWASAQIIFVAVPALVYLAVTAPRVLRKAPAAAAGALVGAAPWLAWSIRYDWASLHTNFPVRDNTYASHLGHFASPLLAQALGVRRPYDEGWVFSPVLGWATLAALVAGFVFLLWKRPPRLRLVLVVAVAYPFLFAISPASFYTGEPRYLFLLSPVLALLVASALATPVRQAAAVVAVAVLSVATLAPLTQGNPVTPRDRLDPLIAALDQRGVRHVFTPYVLAYRLTFDTDERIIATSIGEIRNLEWHAEVRADPLPAYVLFHNTTEQFRLEVVLTHTDNLADHVRLGVFDVYVPKTKLLPEQWLPPPGAAPA